MSNQRRAEKGTTPFYKNPARKETQKADKYVPEYVSRGIEPIKMASPSFAGRVLVASNGVTFDNNPRTRQLGFQKPLNKENNMSNNSINQIPSVGNIEGSWMGMDAEITDDVSDQDIDPNHPVHDDSDLIDGTSSNLNIDSDLDFSSLEEDSYILFINNSAISYGSLEDIQGQVSSFVFGEHELCDGKPVPLENIVVLKKIKIKTGVFLDI